MPTGVHMKSAEYRKRKARQSRKMWRRPGFRERMRLAIKQGWDRRNGRIPATSIKPTAEYQGSTLLAELDDYQRRLSLQREMIQKGLDAVATVRLIITSFNGGPPVGKGES